MKIIDKARNLDGSFVSLKQRKIAGLLPDGLYKTNWKGRLKKIMSELRIFGAAIFGDGATIKSVPLVNVFAAGVNNPLALLDIADCRSHMALGVKKDAKYIAAASIICPLIRKLEDEVDVHQQKNHGIVDMVF